MKGLAWLVLVLVGAAAAVALAECPDGACGDYGPLQERLLATAHPYPPGTPAGKVVWHEVVEYGGAIETALRFEDFELAPGDRLELRDRNDALLRAFTAERPPQPLVRVPSGYVALRLVAHGAKTGFGVRIPYVAFHEPRFMVAGDPVSSTFHDATCLKAGQPCANPSWYEAGRSTARLYIAVSGGLRGCTGTLIDWRGRKDILLTAGHCLHLGFEVLAEFGAEYGPPDCSVGTSECLSPQHGDCEGTIYSSRAFLYSPTCDWGLVALDGDPGLAWGVNALAMNDPTHGQLLYVINHAARQCKEWGTPSVTAEPFTACGFRYVGFHSGPGSSGSGVRRTFDNAIVGVHVTGGGAVRSEAIRPWLDPYVLDIAHAGRPAPGVNVAPRATQAQTSSTFGPQWGGEKAIDGVISQESKWVGADAAPPQWLALDLGREYDITGFGMVSPSHVGESGLLNPKAFSFQTGTSMNGPWTDEFLVGNHLHTEHMTYRGFPDTVKRRRYVRLHLTEANHVDRIARVIEFEVHAHDGTPLPTATPTRTPTPPVASLVEIR